MANVEQLAEARAVLPRPEIVTARVSSSISNWKEKILRRYGLIEYDPEKHRYDHCVFFGMYQEADWNALVSHNGRSTVVWCGSDIFQVGLNARTLQTIPSRHICENRLQQHVLTMLLGGIVPEVRYNFYGDVEKYPISFTPSENPHVWLCSHVGFGAAVQAGLDVLHTAASQVPEVTFHVYGHHEIDSPPNVIYHDHVPEPHLDKEIKNYHAGIRLHEFDGFSEVLAKSLLLGQYPISRIYYPNMTVVKDTGELVDVLRNLKWYTWANPQREWWKEQMEQPLW